MNIFSTFVVIVIVLFVVDVISAEPAATFTPIDSNYDYQNTNTIYSVFTIFPSNSSVPYTMFTIFPSNDGCGVTIETSPPNLVTVNSVFRGHLMFEWNKDVSSAATSGGSVRIGIPSDRLKGVRLNGGHNVQIVEGFTNIYSLSVSSNLKYNPFKTNSSATIRASMMSLSDSTDLELLNDGGQMYVQTNVPVAYGRVTSGGQSWIETPSLNCMACYMTVEGKSAPELHIKGDVDACVNFNLIRSGHLRNGAQLTVTGTISGKIHSNENSTVNAPSCDNVISTYGSTCNAGPQSVDVDVGDLSQNSQILTGTYKCGEDSSSSPDSSPDSDSASVMPSYFAAIVAAAVAVSITTTMI